MVPYLQLYQPETALTTLLALPYFSEPCSLPPSISQYPILHYSFLIALFIWFPLFEIIKKIYQATLLHTLE